ncbi:MAG: hypothetical protein RL477_26 [Pseudomonadota bacterium]|jgi:catechol 2,3-dioxygenase-like lactoylglutathione lyase family enzyme
MADKVKLTGILHFAIGVGDLEVGRRFYEDVLGCKYLRQNDSAVFMQIADQYFVLTNAAHHTPPNPPGEYEFHHAFIVAGNNFDEALRALEAAGYPIIVYEEEGHRTFTGRHAYIHDPFGNAIEIIDFHGIGDFSRPDFQGRGRRQKMKKAKDKARGKKAPVKKAPAKKVPARKSPVKKKAAAKKPVLRPSARPKAAPRRPARRPPRPGRRR